MSWIAVIGWQIFVSALIAIVLTWSWFSTGQIVHVITGGWLGWLSKFPRKVAVWIRAVPMIVSMFLLGDLASVLVPFAHKFFTHLLRALGLQGTQLAVGASVLIIGLYAYRFKVRNQLAYGLVEIVFAGAAGVVTAKQMTTGEQLPACVAGLIGAVYVVSRGASNFVDGTRKAQASSRLD
jgi:hypothetical protein